MTFLWSYLIASLITLASPALGGELNQQVALEQRIRQAELILKQAGKNSARWHSSRPRIERDVHDIAYLLEQAFKAADPAVTVEYAREAHILLQRAVTRGHFHPDDVAEITNEIQGLVGSSM